MSRATRIEFPGAIYHVMGRTVPRSIAFPSDVERQEYLDRIGEYVRAGDLEVHAFCLMTNHYHLLVETPRGGLSRWLQRILGQYAQRFNRNRGRTGHLWQGRYKAVLVESGPYLLECSRYIHLNPNRAAMSRPAERWKWSSYRNYIGGLEKAVAPWVKTSTVLGELGVGRVSRKVASREYRKYIETAKGEKPVNPFERAIAGLVLGNESFVEWVREKLKEKDTNEDEPSLAQLRRFGLSDSAKIEDAVRERFGDPRVKGTSRMLLMYFLVIHSALSPADVSRELGVTRSAVSRGVASITRKIKRDRELQRKFAATIKSFR